MPRGPSRRFDDTSKVAWPRRARRCAMANTRIENRENARIDLSFLGGFLMFRTFTSLALSTAALVVSVSAASAALVPPGSGLQFWVKSDTGVTTAAGNVTT